MVKVVKSRAEVEGIWREEYVVVEEEPLKAWGPDERLRVVGKRIPRVDGIERVTGTAKYTHDLQPPGVLYGKILRCPFAHARIKKLNTAKAGKLASVRSIMTAEDAPEIKWWGGRSFLFARELKYQGEEVAAVVADDPDIARDALQLIEVEYEQLPFVVDPTEAMKPGAPRVHPDGNIEDRGPSTYERGNADRGFADADIIVEDTYRTQVALHNAMETHGSVASWDGDFLTIWDSTQNVFGVRNTVARKLGIPQERVRVIKQFMGGGFGAKGECGKYTVIAALMAKRTARPVKIILDRNEENLAAGNRSSTIQRIRLGATKEGELTAIYLNVISAVGAYGWGAFVDGPAKMLYKCPNVRTEQFTVFTNTSPNTAFRAPGFVEGTFALESAVDDLAAKLGMGPLEFRIKNYAEEEQTEGVRYSSKGLNVAYLVGAERFGWADREKRRFKDGSKVRGFGMASQIWWGAGGPPAYATIKLTSNGTAIILTGTQDLGTGTKTILAQIAAEELGFRLQDVTVLIGDTHVGPYSPISAGSGTIASVGPAVRSAAHDAKNQLLDIASQILKVPLDQITVRDSEIHVNGRQERARSISEVLSVLGNFMIIGKGSRGPNPNEAVNTFGAQFAEVEVDLETGEVSVIRLVAAHESGRVMNALTTESQIEGGVVQGLGFGLMEERILDRATGRVVNANLEDYKIPTVADIPEIIPLPLDLPDSLANNLGAKGVGEPPIIPTPAAIANAVSDAIGSRVRESPMTRARILELLSGRGN